MLLTGSLIWGQAGGNDGGYVIAAGTPNDIKGNENSIIGEFCKNFVEVLIFLCILFAYAIALR